MEESKRLRGESDQINFIHLGYERWQVIGFGKQEEGKMFHKLHVLGMNYDSTMRCPNRIQLELWVEPDWQFK